MKNQFTFLKMSLVGLFLMVANVSLAEVYYICAGTELNIEAGNVSAGEAVIWDIQLGSASISGYPTVKSTTNTTLLETFANAGTYIIKLNKYSASPEDCISGPVEHTVHVLPAFAVNITGAGRYCVTAPTTTTLTVDVTPTEEFTLPEVVYTYQWYESDASGVEGTALGTSGTQEISAISTPGEHYYTVVVNYGLESSAPGTWLGTPCNDKADDPALIDVFNTPPTPTITITAN